MNEKLKELISISADDATSRDDELLIEELKNSQFIMPIDVISSEEEDFQFKPLKLANENNEEFLALFSDEDELVKANIEFQVLNISSEKVAEMIKDDSDEYFGVAINPFSKYSLAIPLNEFLGLF
jgi:hypothetical protein